MVFPVSPSRILKRVLTWILGLVLFCVLTALAAYYSFTFVMGRSQEMAVPDLRGRDIVDVLEHMEVRNLGVRVVGFDYSGTLPQNRVLRQDPPPEHILKAGREVRLVLSRGPRKVQIPNLSGLRREEAVSRLEASGFQAGQVSQMYHDSLPPGHVMASAPPAGAWLPDGKTVHLLTSMGRRPLILRMPDLKAMDGDAMLTLLNSLDLRLTDIRTAWNPDIPPHRILDQEPAAGSPITVHSGVRVVLNEAPGQRTVKPDPVQGMHLVRYRLPHTLIRSHIRGSLTAWGMRFDFVNDVYEGNHEITLLIPGTTQAHILIEENDVPVFEARLQPFQPKPDILYGGGRYGFSPMNLTLPDSPDTGKPQTSPEKETP